MKKMNPGRILAAVILLSALYHSGFAQKSVETTDTPIGELTFENGYPSNESIEKLYHTMDFQRACQAYV